MEGFISFVSMDADFYYFFVKTDSQYQKLLYHWVVRFLN